MKNNLEVVASSLRAFLRPSGGTGILRHDEHRYERDRQISPDPRNEIEDATIVIASTVSMSINRAIGSLKRLTVGIHAASMLRLPSTVERD